MLKAVCTSCLHIFRQPDQKILVMRQHYGGLFVQPDEKSDVAICTNNLISVSLSKARVIFTQNIFQKTQSAESFGSLSAVFFVCVFSRQDSYYYSVAYFQLKKVRRPINSAFKGLCKRKSNNQTAYAWR